jgi:hypothetical protein
VLSSAKSKKSTTPPQQTQALEVLRLKSCLVPPRTSPQHPAVLARIEPETAGKDAEPRVAAGRRSEAQNATGPSADRAQNENKDENTENGVQHIWHLLPIKKPPICKISSRTN